MPDHIQKNTLEYITRFEPEIKALCEPLFSNFGFSFFTYRRMWNTPTQSEQICFSTDSHWITKWHELTSHRASHVQDFLGPLESTKKVFWPSLKGQHEVYNQIMRQYDYAHDLTIYSRFNESVIEAYTFAAAPDVTGVIDIYLNYDEILQRFIHFFKEKMSRLLKETIESKIFITKPTFHLKKEENNETIIKHCTSNNFQEQTLIKNYFVNTPKGEISLTSREFECLIPLSEGKTIKEIGKLLSISPRTIEFHINNMKKKLNVNTKNDVLKVLNNNYNFLLMKKMS